MPNPPVKSRAVPRLVITPGCSVASCMKLRPLSGSSAICRVVTTPPARGRAERHVARLARDRDLFLEAADLHLDVDEQVLADGDRELIADD